MALEGLSHAGGQYGHPIVHAFPLTHRALVHGKIDVFDAQAETQTLGTLFHGKRESVELIVRVIACLAEGLGIRGTARVFEVDANTVLQWLVEAAEQLRAFSQHVLHDVRVRQVELDELFALLNAVKI
jgi:hypothetical protein